MSKSPQGHNAATTTQSADPDEVGENRFALPDRARHPFVIRFRDTAWRVPGLQKAYRALRTAGGDLSRTFNARRAKRVTDRSAAADAELARQRPSRLTAAAADRLAFENHGSRPAGNGRLMTDGGWAETALEHRGSMLPSAASAFIVDGPPALGSVQAANLLYTRDLGPRVWDVATDDQRTLYAMEAMRASPASAAQAREVLAAVEAAIGDLPIETAGPWHDPSLVSVRSDGTPVFIGFPWLSVGGTRAVVDQVLAAGVGDLHFGRVNRLLGGRRPYQTVPGMGTAGRRDVARRWDSIEALLAEHSLGLEGRPVLDVGCNAGMILAAALSRGAGWGLGWDLPSVADHARQLLLALGFTRFDVIGSELGPKYRLDEDIPAHLSSQMDESIVFYLAIRHHVGFIKALGDLPWRAMVYEGGESETVERLDEALAELREFCDFEVAAATTIRDAETLPRPLALLLRR